MFSSVCRRSGWGLVTLAVMVLLAGTVSAQETTKPNAHCIPQKPGDWTTYTIQEGDTLSSIAALADTTVQELVKVNCITHRGMIVAGVMIFVPHTPDNGVAERCRLAGIEPERCRELFGRDHDTAALRCRNAGLTPERCRALLNGDDENIVERCRLAGIEPERCRALFRNDEDAIVERCRLAGIEAERCRAILFGGDHLAERCRLAGIEPERCRELYNDSAGEGDDETRPAVEVRPAIPVTPVPQNNNGRGGRG